MASDAALAGPCLALLRQDEPMPHIESGKLVARAGGLVSDVRGLSFVLPEPQATVAGVLARAASVADRPVAPHRCMKPRRNPDSAAGEWYVDTACIDCGASRHVAPDLVVWRNGKSVFARQPATAQEVLAAWRAAYVCPTASVRTETKQPRPNAVIFPQELTEDVWRCGFNARDSFGAHSYFVRRASGNVLVDAPRHAGELVKWFEAAGGIAHIVLSHRDDVGDAKKYAGRFHARVWIHHDDRSAAPFATDIIEGQSPVAIVDDVAAIPVPGHTRGSVAYLFDERVLFTGDTLAWSRHDEDLVAFRDACWYSWTALADSLEKLAGCRFEWLLPGHGWPVHLPAAEMSARLRALVVRMREGRSP